jgi:hypothetical protein
MQSTQPDFEHLSFDIHDSRADTAHGCFPTAESLLAATRTAEQENQLVLAQNEKDNQIQEQMQVLLSIWNFRRANVCTSTEQRVWSSASTTIQIEGDEAASLLPPPRRYHPSVWKAWTRQLVKQESVRQLRRTWSRRLN